MAQWAKVNSDGENEEHFIGGSVLWTAPEIIRGEQGTLKADVYAFGVCLWGTMANKDMRPRPNQSHTNVRHLPPPTELFTRCVPYKNIDAAALQMRVIQGHRPVVPTHLEHVGRRWQMLMAACWCVLRLVCLY